MRLDLNKVNIAIANSGLTKTEIAKKAGYSRQRLMMVLNQRELTPLAVGKVARALGVDSKDIVEDQKGDCNNEKLFDFCTGSGRVVRSV